MAAIVGPTIAVGSWELAAALKAITVVGISVRLDAVIAVNVHILLLAVSLLGFNFCSSSMALMPSGVQALPRPRRLALMLKTIAPMAG